MIDVRNRAATTLRFLPTPLFSRVMHLIYSGRLPSLNNPKTFSELLAAKNAYDRDPMIPVTADKFTVREYVAKTVGSQYLVPLRQCVENAAELDEDLLSPACVVKASHGCDMTILLPNGAALDMVAVRRTVQKWLDTDFARTFRQSSYIGLQPRAMVEEFVGEGPEPPADYKFYVFNGRVTMIQVSEGRFTQHRSVVLDREWHPLDVKGIYSPTPEVPNRPTTLAKMTEIAEVLAEPFDFVRIDLYSVDDQVYFGEMTHNPGGGKLIWRPRRFDASLGDVWRNGAELTREFNRVSPSSI